MKWYEQWGQVKPTVHAAKSQGSFYLMFNKQLPSNTVMELYVYGPDGQEITHYGRADILNSCTLGTDGFHYYFDDYAIKNDIPFYVGDGVYRMAYKFYYPTGALYEGVTTAEVYLNVVTMTPEMKPTELNKDARCTGQSIVVDLPTCNWPIGTVGESQVAGYAGAKLYIKMADGTDYLSTNVYTPSMMEPGVREQFIFQFPSSTPIPAGTYEGYLVPAGITDKSQLTDLENQEAPFFYRTFNEIKVEARDSATATPIVPDISPNPLRQLSSEQIMGGMEQQDTLTITIPGWQFTGTASRTIEIKNEAELIIVPETEVTDVVEDLVTGTTTLTCTLSDIANMASGTYTVKVFQQGCALDPIATGTFVITDKLYTLNFYHHDHLGTVRMVTDEQGKVVSAHDFTAYGEELTPAEFDTNRMKFTGHERDPETGLDYMLARYYSAGVGRFLQVDPGYDYDTMDPMSWNLYGYVRGNPVMGTDPTGMWDKEGFDKKRQEVYNNSKTFQQLEDKTKEEGYRIIEAPDDQKNASHDANMKTISIPKEFSNDQAVVSLAHEEKHVEQTAEGRVPDTDNCETAEEFATQHIENEAEAVVASVQTVMEARANGVEIQPAPYQEFYVQRYNFAKDLFGSESYGVSVIFNLIKDKGENSGTGMKVFDYFKKWFTDHTGRQ